MRTILLDFSGVIADQDGTLFDGIVAVVQKFATDYRLVVVSSAGEEEIDRLTKSFGIREHLDAIYGGNISHSKSEKIGMIFEKYGIGANDCVMITDSKGDILEAREKGVDCIAVTWGFNDYDVLLSAEPWRIVRLPDELPNAVTEYFKHK